MKTPIFVLGEALMDCIAQPDGRLLPLMGGSPFNLARAAALRGASASYLNPLSTDLYGQGMAGQLQKDGVHLLGGSTVLPTSLAVVQVSKGQPSYGFYREGIADRDYSVQSIVELLHQQAKPGILHTGSLLLIPPSVTIVVRSLEETNPNPLRGRERWRYASLWPAIQRTDRQKDDAAEQPKRCPNQPRHWCGRADLVFLEKTLSQPRIRRASKVFTPR